MKIWRKMSVKDSHSLIYLILILRKIDWIITNIWVFWKLKIKASRTFIILSNFLLWETTQAFVEMYYWLMQRWKKNFCDFLNLHGWCKKTRKQVSYSIQSKQICLFLMKLKFSEKLLYNFTIDIILCRYSEVFCTRKFLLSWHT